MKTVYSSWLLLNICCLAFTLFRVQAYSIASKPLTYLEFVGNPTLEILPRDRLKSSKPILPPERDTVKEPLSLRHDDLIRIQFVAFNRTFHLHLEPNTELYHPEATLVIHHKNQTSTTTRLLPEDYRIYKGVLLDIDSTEKRFNEDIVGLKRRSLFEELEYSPGVLGWARIHVLDDGEISEYGSNTRDPTFEGTFSFKGNLHHIKSIQNFKSTKYPKDPEIPNPSARQPIHRSATMVIFRDNDVKHSNLEQSSLPTKPELQSCSADDLDFNNDLVDGYRAKRKGWNEQSKFGDSFFGRSFRNLVKRGSASGCPITRKINYMGAAADCTYVQSYGSQSAASKQILMDWNSASAVYERTFNITLGLITLEMRDPTCPSTVNQSEAWNRACSANYILDSRLSDFSAWRGARGNDGAGLWHLLSTCNTGSKVGIAWLGQLCQTSATQQTSAQGQVFVSGAGVSTSGKDEWKIVAHEIGHGFGAIHDCTTSTCPCAANCQCCPLSPTVCDANGEYIMNPTSDTVTDNFSTCSIHDICAAFPNIGTCLGEPGQKTTLSVAMCGNGIKEDGEDCDCGSATDCANDPCCDTNCKFKGNAVCDDKNDLCCSNCQLKANGTVCRPAVSSCDVTEVCNGTSSTCPPDLHSNDGTPCGNGLSCASGQCTSRDAQCASLGSRMNITKACTLEPSPGCTISCANPSDSTSCVEINGDFIDGTSCGYGGKCYKGNCDSGGLDNTIVGFFDQHKEILIPAICVLGGLLLLCAVNCCYKSYRSQRVRPMQRIVSAPSQEQVLAANSSWVDPTPYNGPLTSNHSLPPSYTPPPYTPPPYLNRSASVQRPQSLQPGNNTIPSSGFSGGVDSYSAYPGSRYNRPLPTPPRSQHFSRNSYDYNQRQYQ